MTALYGSTAMPKKVFGEGALLDVFYGTMKSMAPAAWELNEAFLAMWDPETYINSWILPDNFHVNIKVMAPTKDTVHFMNQPFDVYYNENKPVEQGRSLGANTIHSIDGMIVRELTRRCSYDPKKINKLRELVTNDYLIFDDSACTEDDNIVLTLWDHYKKSGFLSARILDHLNIDNMAHVDINIIRELLDSLPEKPFTVVAIHDAFRVLPTYGDDLRKQYNLQLQMIAKSDLLDYLVSQIIGQPVKLGKLDPNLHLKIKDTNYALS